DQRFRRGTEGRRPALRHRGSDSRRTGCGPDRRAGGRDRFLPQRCGGPGPEVRPGVAADHRARGRRGGGAGRLRGVRDRGRRSRRADVRLLRHLLAVRGQPPRVLRDLRPAQHPGAAGHRWRPRHRCRRRVGRGPLVRPVDVRHPHRRRRAQRRGGRPRPAAGRPGTAGVRDHHRRRDRAERPGRAARDVRGDLRCRFGRARRAARGEGGGGRVDHRRRPPPGAAGAGDRAGCHRDDPGWRQRLRRRADPQAHQPGNALQHRHHGGSRGHPLRPREHAGPGRLCLGGDPDRRRRPRRSRAERQAARVGDRGRRRPPDAHPAPDPALAGRAVPVRPHAGAVPLHRDQRGGEGVTGRSGRQARTGHEL
ncbi:MAG: Alcohol dehydrogenase, partial [uncultured Corynebacteriales bacterium]